jgi:hypothetical protein
MTILSYLDVKNKVEATGIAFIQSSVLFRKRTPYKITLRQNIKRPTKRTKIAKYIDEADDSKLFYTNFRKTSALIMEQTTLLDLCNEFNHDILQVHGPVSQKQVAVLLDTNVKLRHNLYYNKYRYAVKFSMPNEDIEDDIICCLKTHDNDVKFIDGWMQKHAYFNSQDALVILKLTYDSYIIDVKEAVLFSEIE